MGAIYKITNNINGKVYIGKTIREVKTRWQEHIQYCTHQADRYNTPLYQAMRKYGIENFSIETILDNINDENQLNKLEQELIETYKSTSHEHGYNVALGGDGGRTSSKLTESQAEEIRIILADRDNLQSLSEIGELFNISGSVVRAINQGISWYSSNYIYPIRKYNTTGLSLTRSEYKNIIYDIQNTDMQLSDIAKKYHLSEARMTSINQGKECYSADNEYYNGIYTGDFPIRKDNRTFSSANDFVPIFYEVLFTKDSMAKIGERHGIKGNTIQCIISGIRRKELTKDFITPMRKNIDVNQKIFLSLYPNYKKE